MSFSCPALTLARVLGYSVFIMSWSCLHSYRRATAGNGNPPPSPSEFATKVANFVSISMQSVGGKLVNWHMESVQWVPRNERGRKVHKNTGTINWKRHANYLLISFGQKEPLGDVEEVKQPHKVTARQGQKIERPAIKQFRVLHK